MKSIISFLKRPSIYIGIARYLLGVGMFPYGLSKILRTQFVVIPFDNWQVTLENLPSTTLTWAFLGHSPWFQIMLGFLELIPALLLLFRRTTLLGAVLMLPMTLNVFLINKALNLWETTQFISLIFLILNLIVLVLQWKKVRDIIYIMIYHGQQFRFWLPEILINFLIIGLLLYSQMPGFTDYIKQTNELTGDWYNQRPNEWILQKETLNDSILMYRPLKYYFGAYGMHTKIENNVHSKRDESEYSLDEEKRILTITNNNDSIITDYDYSIIGDSILLLTKIDRVSKDKLVQIFNRRIINSKKNRK